MDITILRTVYSAKHYMNKLVMVPPKVLQELVWWLVPLNMRKGVSFLTSSSAMVLIMNPLETVWGTHLLHLQMQGVLSPYSLKLHMDNLELRAIGLASIAFLPLLRSSVVQILMENTLMRHCINKQGGACLFHCAWKPVSSGNSVTNME